MTEDSLNISMVYSDNYAPNDVKQQSPYDQSGHPHQSILDELENLIEALTKTGIGTRDAKTLAARNARAVSLYFKRLASKFPYSSLTSFVNQYKVTEAHLLEGKKEDAKRLLGKAVEARSSDLETTLISGATKSYELGVGQAFDFLRIKPTFALIDDTAKKWIRKRAARAVKDIDKITRDRLSNLLIHGVDTGQSVPEIARNIRNQIKGWSDIKLRTAKKGRALLIANTELNEAMSESSLRTYKRLDIAGKSWSTVGDDRVSEDCLANEGAGIIPVDATFPGGTDRPPQHPGCRCTLVPEKRLK